jgi:hypothetical protein
MSKEILYPQIQGVTVVVIVRAAGEAVVTCGHEVSHGAGITESGEIPIEVGVVCWGEGEDATLRSMPSPASLHQRRQDDWQTYPSSHALSDEGL